MAIKVGRVIRRYSLVVLFPTFTFGGIYADYSRTQQYKKQLAAKNVSNNS